MNNLSNINGTSGDQLAINTLSQLSLFSKDTGVETHQNSDDDNSNVPASESLLNIEGQTQDTETILGSSSEDHLPPPRAAAAAVAADNSVTNINNNNNNVVYETIVNRQRINAPNEALGNALQNFVREVQQFDGMKGGVLNELENFDRLMANWFTSDLNAVQNSINELMTLAQGLCIQYCMVTESYFALNNNLPQEPLANDRIAARLSETSVHRDQAEGLNILLAYYKFNSIDIPLVCEKAFVYFKKTQEKDETIVEVIHRIARVTEFLSFKRDVERFASFNEPRLNNNINVVLPGNNNSEPGENFGDLANEFARLDLEKRQLIRRMIAEFNRNNIVYLPPTNTEDMRKLLEDNEKLKRIVDLQSKMKNEGTLLNVGLNLNLNRFNVENDLKLLKTSKKS